MNYLKDLENKFTQELKELFNDRPYAWAFLCLYTEYCHAVDDLVDQDKPFLIRDTIALASNVFNTDYWRKWGQALYITERLIHNTYFDMVEWEQDGTTEWKKQHARVLNHCAYNMVFAMILIEFGEQKLKEFSLRFREFVHEVNND